MEVIERVLAKVNDDKGTGLVEEVRSLSPADKAAFVVALRQLVAAQQEPEV